MHRSISTPSGRTLACLNVGEARATIEEVYGAECYVSAADVRGASTIVDVGANIGVFSIFCLDAAPHAVVFAIEPMPPVFEVLAVNLEPFGARARAVCTAVGAPAAAAPFAYYPGQTIMSGRYVDAVADRDLVRQHVVEAMAAMSAKRRAAVEADLDALLDQALATVEYERPVVTVSQLIADHGIDRIDLLKVDAERSELDILRSVKERDWSRIRAVAVEVEHTPLGRERDQAVELLRAAGFEVTAQRYLTTPHRALDIVRGRRPSTSRG